MEYIQNTFYAILSFYNAIAVYLLLGFLVAALLHLFFPDSFIKRHLGTGQVMPVLKATLFGIPLPLCSCGVVPVAAALKKQGANSGATLSFMTATPQIGADSFFMTLSLLGPVFAFFRIVAAFFTALLSGIIVNIIEKSSEELQTDLPTNNNNVPRLKNIKSLPHYIEFEVLGPIALTLIIGIVIAGLISALVPGWIFTQYLSNPWLSMFVMLIVGIPLYVCASASTPIAASLVLKGMAPGAALVFLLTGPATNAVTIATIVKTLGKRAAIVYILSIASVSMFMGFLLNNYFLDNPLLKAIHGGHEMSIPSWINTFSGFILALMLLYYFAYTYIIVPHRRKNNIMNVPSLITLTVNGMTCSHCAESVRKAVASVSGTENIAVDLSGKKVNFTISKENNKDKVQEAIKNAGFDC